MYPLLHMLMYLARYHAEAVDELTTVRIDTNGSIVVTAVHARVVCLVLLNMFNVVLRSVFQLEFLMVFMVHVYSLLMYPHLSFVSPRAVAPSYSSSSSCLLYTSDAADE